MWHGRIQKDFLYIYASCIHNSGSVPAAKNPRVFRILNEKIRMACGASSIVINSYGEGNGKSCDTRLCIKQKQQMYVW